jgi:type IV secretory pathway component VirB8
MNDMVEMVPPSALVERGEASDEIREILAENQRQENRRWWWDLTKNVAPWACAAVFGCYALGAGIIMHDRPVPRDRVYLAGFSADGTYTVTEKDDLSVGLKETVRRSTVIRFVQSFMAYAWRHNQSDYHIVSVMTAGEALQAQYQKEFKDSEPNNRDKRLGPNVTQDVPAIEVFRPKAAPNAADVSFLVRTRRADGSAVCQHFQGRITFREDKADLIPIGERVGFDPLGIIFVSFDKWVDPLNPREVPCNT